MATVTALVDRVTKLAPLNSSTGSSDRALALDWLNQVYAEVCADLGTPVTTFSATLSGTTTDVALSSLGITRFGGFAGSIQAGSTPMSAATEDDIRDQRILTGSGSGGWVGLYAILGGTLLMLYPTQSSGTVLSGTYFQNPLVLVESGAVASTSEATPTSIEAAYHHGILSNKATALGMRYKQNEAQAEAYDNLGNDAIGRYKAFLKRRGGLLVNSMGAQYGGAPARDFAP